MSVEKEVLPRSEGVVVTRGPIVITMERKRFILIVDITNGATTHQLSS